MFHDCHAHILNIDFVPDEFIGPSIPLSKKLMTKFSKILHYLWPFSSRDGLDDLASFEKNMGQSQEQNFLELQRLLPENSCICVVTMDFFSVKGKSKVPFEEQLIETLALRDRVGSERMKVFFGVDPNAPYREDLIENYINKCDGVKIYPPLDANPTKANFMRLWALCERNSIPITAHCGDSGVSAPYFGNSAAKDNASPLHWETVLGWYPNLKINLAHFGAGNEAWEKKIIELMHRYPNVYTDTAYSIGSDARMERYKIWLEKESILHERLLFGTDYFILNIENNDLRENINRARDFLGYEVFRRITEVNPLSFLRRY